MSITGIPGNIPHQGIKERNPPELHISRVRSPTTSDNGPQFNIGDMWVDTSLPAFYVLLSKEQGIADWALGGGAVSGIFTINTIFPDGGGDFTIAGGTGITITPGVNSITISVSGSVGQTITGDVGGAQAPVAGNWDIQGTNVAGSGISTDTSVAAPRVDVQMASPYSLSDFSFDLGTVGGTRTVTTEHTNDSAGASATNLVQVAGAASDDSYDEFAVSSVRHYSFGIDNSDSDILKLNTDTTSVTPSSGTELFRMTSAGERTMPLQPAFNAFLANNDFSVTGDGTPYTIGTAPGVLTVAFDQGSNLSATGTFTTPIAGIYYFTMRVSYGGLGSTNTSSLLTVSAAGVNDVGLSGNIGFLRNPALRASVSGSTLLSLPASTAVTFIATVGGALAATVDVLGDSIGLDTFISGWLVT